ncbi:MAG TPA: site-2 protease family protein [Candidatus Methanofastidiosa archaeon]|nr:site-2 protease family protein [Candidatus Methanofastidiosa archaeon]
MNFSKREIRDLLIAWAVLSVILSRLSVSFLPVSVVAVGTAFVCHELAHKYLAQRYRLYAEFRIWKQGLLFAVVIAVISLGNFIFAAPGAVYIYGFSMTNEQNGKISLAGPLLNLFIAIASILLDIAFPGTRLFPYLAIINGYLGFFNLLPFPPLDGSKVINWRRDIYFGAVATAFLIIMFIEYLII